MLLYECQLIQLNDQSNFSDNSGFDQEKCLELEANFIKVELSTKFDNIPAAAAETPKDIANVKCLISYRFAN
jgi:hypothetical protein